MGPEDPLNLTRFPAHSQRAPCFPAPNLLLAREWFLGNLKGHSYNERGGANGM